MSRGRTSERLAMVVVALVLASCRDEPAPAPALSATSGTSDFPPDESSADVDPPVGPIASATPRDRELAVHALLRGEGAAAELPLVATDDGTEVDPSLRDVIAPRTPGEMRVGAITGDGVIAPEVVGRIVRAAAGRLIGCYHRALALNPNLTGRVGVRMQVSAAGRVEVAVNNGSDIPDSGMVECVVKVMSTLSFPTSGEGHTVIVPMLYQPAET